MTVQSGAHWTLTATGHSIAFEADGSPTPRQQPLGRAWRPLWSPLEVVTVQAVGSTRLTFTAVLFGSDRDDVWADLLAAQADDTVAFFTLAQVGRTETWHVQFDPAVPLEREFSHGQYRVALGFVEVD